MNYLRIWAVLIILLPASAWAQTRFGKLLPQSPGLVSFSLRNQFKTDVPGTFDKIRAMGITNMEMSSLFGQTAQQIRQMLDERGMRCTSYGTAYESLLQKPDSIISIAKTLGAEFVRVAWIPHTDPFNLDQAKKTVVDFNRMGKVLKDSGLTFCYHNHGFEFQPHQNGTLFDYLVTQTNPDWVSFEMDILWVFHPGHDPVSLLKKYPKRFRLMHVKDLKKGVGGDLTGKTPIENDVTLGTGQLNLPAILKAARKTRIKYYYIEDENLNAPSQIPNSLTYLKQL